MPLDRYYIERLLVSRCAYMRGGVLEVKDSRYTEQFRSDVVRSDVIDIEATNPAATIIADLSAASEVPSDAFDCFVFTQTLQFVHDFGATVARGTPAVASGRPSPRHRAGGESRRPSAGIDGDFWRFTAACCARVFSSVFGYSLMGVGAYGNVLAAIGFLTGLAREDLSDRELDFADEFFPVLIGVRAVKA
jgi:hypothetical protein